VEAKMIGRGLRARVRAGAVAVVVGAATIVVLPQAAHAATQCFTDAAGDTAVAQPKGDIVQYCLTVDSVMAVSVQMSTPSDPTTDPYWNDANVPTMVFWALGVSDGNTSAYDVGLDNTGAAVFREESDGTITPVCAASSSYNGTTIRVTFSAQCVGSPAQAWVGAVSIYDTSPNDPNSDPVLDVAPDGPTMSGPVAAGSGTTPPPGPTDPVTRIAGADRVSTAVLASQAGFPTAGSAGGVVLASAANYPDALVGVPLAAAHVAPVLLTPRDALPDGVYAEIQRAAGSGKPVYILGGTAAVGAAVATRLTDGGFQVTRFGGNDRYETAVLVANSMGSPVAILEATGRNFPDALAAGSGAGKAGGVVLLTDGSTVPPGARTYLDGHTGVPRYAVGGAAAAADPGAPALVGASRYETATAVAGRFFTAPPTVGIASGDNYPDALAGGLHALRAGGPLVLTGRDALPPATASYLQANRASITSGWVYGGVAAVADGVVTAIRQAIT
jgi:putative cell wall-binding protein